MTKQDIYQRVIHIIFEISGFPENEIDLKSTLKQDLNLSSLELLFIIGTVETEFQIQLPFNKLPQIETVEEAVRLIEQLLLS